MLLQPPPEQIAAPPPPGSPSLPDNGIDRGLHWRRWEELVATLQLTAAEDNNVDVFGDSKTTRTAMNATTYSLTCDIEFVHPGGSTSSSRRSRSGSTVRGWVIGRRSPGDATGGALSSNDIVGIHIGGQDAGNGRWGIKQAAAGHRRCRELVWHCDNQQGQQQEYCELRFIYSSHSSSLSLCPKTNPVVPISLITMLFPSSFSTSSSSSSSELFRLE